MLNWFKERLGRKVLPTIPRDDVASVEDLIDCANAVMELIEFAYMHRKVAKVRMSKELSDRIRVGRNILICNDGVEGVPETIRHLDALIEALERDIHPQDKIRYERWKHTEFTVAIGTLLAENASRMRSQ